MIHQTPALERGHQSFRFCAQAFAGGHRKRGVEAGAFHRRPDQQALTARHGVDAVAPDHGQRQFFTFGRDQRDHLALDGGNRSQGGFDQPAPGAGGQDEDIGLILREGGMGDGGAAVMAVNPHHGLVGQQAATCPLEGMGQGRTQRPGIHQGFLGRP